jgi:transposase-like protein
VSVGAAVRLEFIEAARPGRHAAGDRWFAGERYLKIAGRWTCLYRAVGQHGQVIASCCR